ncbi:MAG: prolipoprotein diacylglyceryl transferase family protein [Haemophilus parainfluenzae]
MQDPLYLFRVWEGGMSFHGGLIGVIISMIWTSYSQKRSFWQTADFVAPLIPFGLDVGRIGNFINLELLGTRTGMFRGPWFAPNDPLLATTPSFTARQEAFLEGFVLFIVLNMSLLKSLVLWVQ